MITYRVSPEGYFLGDGSEDRPFRTIQQAADVARAGDVVLISGGVYREWVDPPYGGLSERERITYKAVPGERVVISGAEQVENWKRGEDGLWETTVENERLGANPFAERIQGDWFDDFGWTHHTGEVYLDGEALYEAPDRETASKTLLRWFALPGETSTRIWANFGDADPNERVIEVNARTCCFFPRHEGVDYIALEGIWFRQAATQWAPPTAFQTGAVGTHWSKGWRIQNCIVSDCKCSGISLGKRHDPTDNDWVRNARKGGAQTYTEIIFSNLRRGWSKKTVGSHEILDNHIYNCGQTGIVGNMGGAFSHIARNHIHHINIRGEFGGAEVSGIKLHSAIDALIEQNSIHHCTRGLWLDWQAQGARVSRNTFFENVKQDLFIEVCHGPCVVDNNLFLSQMGLWNVSQGGAFVNNLFLGRIALMREMHRFTLYHMPHSTFVYGSMLIYGGDDRYIGNIFAANDGTAVYDGYPDIATNTIAHNDDGSLNYLESKLPVCIRDNLYINGAKSYGLETGAEIPEQPVSMQVIQQNGHWYLEADFNAIVNSKRRPAVTTKELGKAFETDAWYENADGSDMLLDKDFFGAVRPAEGVQVGPFEEFAGRIRLDCTFAEGERICH